MPRATVNLQDTIRHDLKSCPDGFVVIRRLSYGEKLHRRQMVSKMAIQSGGSKKDFAGEMELINEKATQFDFQTCIVDHNLEDESGRKLDFKQVQDIRRLDPKIGDEIDKYMNELNNFEEEDEEGN